MTSAVKPSPSLPPSCPGHRERPAEWPGSTAAIVLLDRAATYARPPALYARPPALYARPPAFSSKAF